MVDPAPNAPVDDVVNPHVQVDAAPITSDEGAVVVTVTAPTAVPVMVTPDEGATAVVSAEVAKAKFDPP
jgi:hypothetical protein